MGTTTGTTNRPDARHDERSASELITRRLAAIGGWRGETLERVRALIRAADPAVVEAVKWRKPSNPDGVPVWERDGILCTGDAFRGKVKVTFARGAELDDPAGLFNAGLEGGAMRAIDLREGDALDAAAFTALVRAAAARNVARRQVPAGAAPRRGGRPAR